MFTGCGDGIVRAYDAKSATLRKEFVGHEGSVNCLTAVDEKLFTGSSDGTMRVWSTKDIMLVVLELHIMVCSSVVV